MMDFEFDKEIDSLLRQSAQGKLVLANQESLVQNVPSPHLDADALAAFAENALPEKAKQNYIIHLADCDNCRKILSDVITLNSEMPDEIVHVKEKQFIPAPIPWYRKLFAVPNLVYSLGALVLIFSGVAVFTVLQNSDSQQTSEVSQTSERQPNGKGISSDGDTVPTDSYAANTSVSNAASMNASSNSSTITATNSVVVSAPITAPNSNSLLVRKEAERNSKNESKAVVPNTPQVLAETQTMMAPPPPPWPQKENNFQADGEVTDLAASKRSVPQKQVSNLPLGSAKTAPKPIVSSETSKSRKLETDKDDAKRKSNEAAAVGGKTFERKNNVWYDSAYRGQSTTNIRRGTSEYKNLDANLRNIAENISGTVVIIWKEKAYRIQ